MDKSAYWTNEIELSRKVFAMGGGAVTGLAVAIVGLLGGLALLPFVLGGVLSAVCALLFLTTVRDSVGQAITCTVAGLVDVIWLAPTGMVIGMIAAFPFVLN